MMLQGCDIAVQYTQNHNLPLSTGVANCQNYSKDKPATVSIPSTAVLMEPSHHYYFDENICQSLIIAYVDRYSYNHQRALKAGAGIVWLNDDPCPPQQFNFAPHTLQYAEIEAILITLDLKQNSDSRTC